VIDIQLDKMWEDQDEIIRCVECGDEAKEIHKTEEGAK